MLKNFFSQYLELLLRKAVRSVVVKSEKKNRFPPPPPPHIYSQSTALKKLHKNYPYPQSSCTSTSPSLKYNPTTMRKLCTTAGQRNHQKPKNIRKYACREVKIARSNQTWTKIDQPIHETRKNEGVFPRNVRARCNRK